MTAIWIILGAIVLIVLFLVYFYNTLVQQRIRCESAWSQIDVQLKRRYDLIPNLVETVKGYAVHEREVMVAVTEARNRAVASTGSPESQAKDENAFVGSLRQLFAVSENYPDLKASENFLQLQKELANTEDRIQASRRFYNANVRDINTRVEVFPSNLIAGIFKFTKEEFFEIEDAGVRLPPQVSTH